MNRSFRSRATGVAAAAVALAALSPLSARAQVGSTAYPVTADPHVPRPKTTPIIVPLFTGDVFDNYAGRPFTYTPPSSKGPWSKIVLVADLSENSGVQYDRTFTIGVGNANLFFGTTPEPTSSRGPTWHVERDVTDYASLLASSQSGEAELFNVVISGEYTGIPTGSAYLEFYPDSAAVPKAVTPSLVVPLNAGNGPDYLDSATDELSATTTFPTNVTSAYLDLITQPQGSDEFWYTNVPDDLVDTLDEYGGTSFREAEITLDGKAAGAAPVYPWIFTGGIDPDLWLPIPGIQTLNFKPYRVDLTPFAALLDDGQEHTVAVSVYNDDNYFAVTGSLLLFQDPYLKKVTGSLLQDTIAEPNPTINSTIAYPSAEDVIGEINTTSTRQFVTAGVVNTSKGPVTTRVAETLDFSNAQVDPILVDAAGNYSFIQQITQKTDVATRTTTSVGKLVSETNVNLEYPFSVDYTEIINADFTALLGLKVGVHQGFLEGETLVAPDDFFSSSTSNLLSSTDSVFDNSLPQASNQVYTYTDSRGHSYYGKVTSANGLVTSDSRIGSLPVQPPIHD